MSEPIQTQQNNEGNEFIFSKYQLQIISILECMDINTLLVSREHKILYANKYYLTTTGFDIDHVIGSYCYQIICNKNIQKSKSCSCPFDTIFETKKPLITTGTFIDKDKNEYLAHTIVSLIRISDMEEACLYMIIPVRDKIHMEIESSQALIKSQNLLDIIVQNEHKNDEIKRIDGEMKKIRDMLIKKNEELNSMYTDMISRENKMTELKKEIIELKE